MKWIGQYIQSLISRFRNDVYLEATETGTIASGGNLGLDANNKIVKAAEVGSSVDLTSEVTGVLPVANGGSGASTLASGCVLTGSGTSAITAQSTFTYATSGDGSATTTMGQDTDDDLSIIRRAHSDGNGGPLKVMAGSATNGQTDKAGGDLELHGGLGTGAQNGGDIQFYSHKRGSSGTTIGTPANIASIQPGTSNTNFYIYEDAGSSTDDYYRVAVSANGETLITTHDAAAMAAHYKVDADGDITFDPATGIVRAGWHGSTTRIKILHSDFIADDGGRPLMIDDTGVASENLFLETFSTFPAYVTIAIPSGYKATHVMIHGSGTGAVEVWEHQIDSKTGVSKGTGNVETEINITDVTSSSTNYLFIQVAVGSDEIHGGYVTIVAV